MRFVNQNNDDVVHTNFHECQLNWVSSQKYVIDPVIVAISSFLLYTITDIIFGILSVCESLSRRNPLPLYNCRSVLTGVSS